MTDYPTMVDYLADKLHYRNIQYGFKDAGEPRDPVHVLMLIGSEIAEAFEELRKGYGTSYRYFTCGKPNKDADYHEVHFQPNLLPLYSRDGDGMHGMDVYACPDHGRPLKPEGFGVELADALIRILDAGPEFGLMYDYLVPHKMAFNDTREPKHGKTM